MTGGGNAPHNQLTPGAARLLDVRLHPVHDDIARSRFPPRKSVSRLQNPRSLAQMW
jgi:hypothetical protein